jgi:hypothetical protein
VSGFDTAYVQPTDAYPAPLEGLALYGFVQQWIVGITGLPGSLVRPAWQGEPNGLPQPPSIWAALTINTRPSDTFPYVVHDEPGQSTLKTHETLEVRVSFFDLGVGGQADYYAALLRDGTKIEQNRWVLQRNGWGLTETGTITPAPVLTKERWQYRADLALVMSREIVRAYPVPDIATAAGTIVAQHGPTEVVEPFTTAGLG